MGIHYTWPVIQQSFTILWYKLPFPGLSKISAPSGVRAKNGWALDGGCFLCVAVDHPELESGYGVLYN